MKKLIKICEYSVFIIFFILIFFMRQKATFLLVVPVFILIYLFTSKVNIKKFGLFIFIISLIIRIVSILYLDTQVTDDFKLMFDASRSLINGNLAFLNTPYFKTFTYQLGHVLYQAFLLKIWNNILFLKIVNSIITSLIVLFIYLISKRLFSERIARSCSLLYLFYLYPIYLNSILTNQHLPALIILIVIYLLITKKYDYKLFIICGVLLSIANVFRTESIVIILGIVGYNICLSNKDNFKKMFSYSLILICVYIVVNFIINSSVYLTLNTNLTNKAPTWKFYCGLSDRYNGIYNSYDEGVYFTSNDTNKLLLDRIKNNYTKLPILFLKKEVILWTQTNYDIRINNNINNNIFNFILNFNQGILNFTYLLFVISLFPWKKDYKLDKILLLKIILALYYGVYMFIEISPRYAYILDILIFLCIGLALEELNNLYKKRFKSN